MVEIRWKMIFVFQNFENNFNLSDHQVTLREIFLTETSATVLEISDFTQFERYVTFPGNRKMNCLQNRRLANSYRFGYRSFFHFPNYWRNFSWGTGGDSVGTPEILPPSPHGGMSTCVSPRGAWCESVRVCWGAFWIYSCVHHSLTLVKSLGDTVTPSFCLRGGGR